MVQTSRWKACLVVTPEQQSKSRQAVGRLIEMGFDGIDIFAPKGVPLPDNDFVVRHRCPQYTTESGLFVEAIKAVHGNFVGQTDFVLYIRADVCLWSDAKLLMEHTIEPRFVAMYFPYAPSPFFAGEDRSLPCSGRGEFGWCGVKVDQSVAAAPCFAVNKHTAMLMAGACETMVDKSSLSVAWTQNHMRLIRMLEIQCYAHTPSLAWLHGQPPRGEAVPSDAVWDQEVADRSFYLN